MSMRAGPAETNRLEDRPGGNHESRPQGMVGRGR
jgi:hypothetical protein